MPIRSLSRYRRKRNFASTPEPKPARGRRRSSLAFVVQKHRASHLHYDFRLELDGVLKSWAVPKGPSLDPRQKRLAIRVEDHPWDYRNFEGTIPEGNYGAGDVIVWDRGTYRCRADSEGRAAPPVTQRVTQIVLGPKLRGGFALVRFGTPRRWLLIKANDQYATLRDVTLDDRSVKSHRRLPDAKPEKVNRKRRRT
jgi:bifunctional non-homologous end joining protein LigD